MRTESSPKPVDGPHASFEEVLGRLSEVVEHLERGDLPLEESLALFEEGVRLSRAGSKRIDEAERRVEQLLASADGLATRPVATTEDKEPESP